MDGQTENRIEMNLLLLFRLRLSVWLNSFRSGTRLSHSLLIHVSMATLMTCRLLFFFCSVPPRGRLSSSHSMSS